jgi:hypothetical protein
MFNDVERRDAVKFLGMLLQKFHKVIAMDVCYSKFLRRLYLLRTDIYSADISIYFLLQELKKATLTAANIKNY